MRQRAELDRLLAHAQTRVQTAFTTAEAQMTPLLAQFQQAYTAEYDRVTADLTYADQDEETDERELSLQRAVHLRHWLITSGWRRRLQGAFAGAAHQAAQVTLAALKDSQGQALALGTAHARALMTAAMQPAMRAGMDWQPNAVGATPRRHRKSRTRRGS